MNGTISEEDIMKNVQDMEYITVHPRSVNPSYYKLSDDTIIQALVNINYLVPDPKNTNGFAVNSQNTIIAYVSKENRKPELFVSYNPSDLSSGIIEEDVELITLRENFSVYELSNGTVLSVKTVIGQVNKTKYYSREGEPVYIVSANPIIKVKKS